MKANCDRVYLLRIDKLLGVILDDFLPYFRFWKPEDSRPPKALIRVTRTGQELWSTGHVSPTSRKGVYEVIAISEREYVSDMSLTSLSQS